MPMTEERVRLGLPNRGEPLVDPEFIETQIAVAQRRLTLKVGAEHLEDPMALEYARLWATAKGWEIYDADVSNESPRSEALLAQAASVLEELDQLTSSLTETGRSLSRVGQTFADPLWVEEDFVPVNGWRGCSEPWRR